MPSGEVMGVKQQPTSTGVGGLEEDKKAVYKNDDEYDEDLAQLDMLLHYVNNLSASLEFLAWENKRISTDLVPTLLNMYDALYARLSEGADGTTTTSKSCERDEGGGGGRSAGGGGGVGGGGGELKMGMKGFSNGSLDLSKIGEEERASTKENGNSGATENGLNSLKENGVCNERLFIEEKDVENENQVNNNCIKCDKCGVLRTSKDGCRCSAKCVIAESITSMFENIENDLGSPDSFYENVDKRRPRREHIYAEPQFLIKPKDSPKSTTSSSSTNTCSSSASSSTLTSTTSTTSSSSDKLPGTPASPPMGFDPRKLKDVYRPLSSISSSSSSSSNSLPRGPPGAATSYLASAESLEDNDADHSDTEETTRRRDRTIKTRREKAQRTGSGDSGVQCHSISLPAPPTLRPRYCDPNLAYMDRIVLEIVETEAIYVRDLKEIIEGYLEYWRRQSESGITQKQVDDLFSNIEQIYAFNKEFLSELEACGVDPVEVARCFVRNNNGFAIYTQYCTNYPRTVSVLTELMRGEASVRAFRERQLALGHTLPLGSYLLKPVQRILKYHLLLGNIVKHFEKECSGYSEIWNALSAMTGMAHHINDMKRRHEHAVRVQEIQSLLYGWQFEDLTTYGELAAEGTFRMWGAKGLRHVFLFDKMILIAKKKEENILMYKTHILCSNLMLIESVPGEPLSFHVIPFDNPRMQYTLEARSLEQKREWTLQLKRVILENYSANIPAHARQLVMELGQSKPDDVLMSEVRSSGRRAHHAPEYLEKRKVDRERRRSSEGGLNTKLRLRRSSRTRKEKEEKVTRSRSVSRTRDTEDEELDRKVSTTSAPTSCEKPKLKLTMWGRRRSEPGIGSRESLSLASTINLDEALDTPPPSLGEPPPPLDVATPTGPATPEVSLDGASMSEYEREDGDVSRVGREYEEGSENGENLEEIISQLLQNKLQLQKLLLSKQRRGLIRKKLPLRYETSDTENEDGPFKAGGGGGSYAGSDAGDTLRHEDVGDYVDFYFNGVGKEGECATLTESANVSSSECQSMYSSAVSVHQPCDNKSLSNEKKTKPVRRSSSDLSFKKMPTLKKMNSNYDNLLNIWSTIRGKSPEKRQSGAFQQPKASQTPTATLERPRLRRAQSFSAEKCLSNNHENIYVSAVQLTPPQPHTAPVETSKPPEVWVRDESPRENRERPVTIAFYNSNEVSLSALEQYLNQPRPPRRCSERFPYDTEDNMTDYSMTPHMSMDNILSIHPEHKIYKSTNNKSTLKTVLNKITSPRNNKTASEPSGSVYNYSMESELDKGMDKRASKMVYNMARQCSKTLKERIKQIRAEDVEKAPAPKSPTENVYALPMYKQGSSSIGARLAGTNEPSDYAVPRIRPLDQKPKSDLRPDSVLSSSSILTSSSSSSSSSSRDTKFLEGIEVSNNMANVEEENEENQETPSFDSDASADSYYERSFEAIENLETEIFRDSAIYSDPEDTESPPNSLNQERSSTSPKPKSSNSKKFSPRSSTKLTKKAMSPSRHASPEIVVTPEEPSPAAEAESTSSNGVASVSPRSSPQAKKVPPPVPAKPDSIKTKRPCGNLILQQLKNLEECTKFSREDQNNSPSFDGIRSLDDRRKELDGLRSKGDDGEEAAASPRGSPERENGADRSSRSPRPPSLMTPPIIKSPITLSPLSLPVTRSSSVPPRLSPRPSLTPESPLPASVGTHSPAGSERASPLPPTCQDAEELDEPRVARGWVRHVIGKLQAETDV
ncbi:uncharacterized protein LOC122267221 isoform X2 [Penaeus japonicus]|uniref:uncharacterized protein LOC122267221 isoform X2 n=1 Tax=Penaeus japonicus TaxID=27405 RepID=UPI001C715AA7|nr:uncharacterized protein LOC122267221 isoform X2 [Penaeus japonicus]